MNQKMNYEEIGLKVGLEIHQQLATRTKLFCNCKETRLPPEITFKRRLRLTQSELGHIDPAAMFEFKKGKITRYFANSESSCLVEADEEPPHNLKDESIEALLMVSLLLNSKIVDELHIMRKIVIDGSNTTGFQRTLIGSLGGSLRTKKRDVGIQIICLEEDAARIIGENNSSRDFDLNRLGTPLIEIALEPVTGSPEEIQEIALSLGRLLRSTKNVARGLGTIRQDINVSILGGNVVEVKGIQKLDLISKVVEYEVFRQLGLLKIKNELEIRGLSSKDVDNPKDVTDVFKNCESPILKKVIKEKGIILCIKLRGFSSLIGYEPFPDVRLGIELAEIVRFYGLGGIFHSDELPSYGISKNELNNLRLKIGADEKDGFILLGGSKGSAVEAIKAVVKRINEIFIGIPSETRGPTFDGKTKFSRPRPGPARMYPETDIPPTPINEKLLDRIRKKLPKPWEELIQEYISKYNLSKKLALQVFDSEFSNVFEYIVIKTKVNSSFVAATLTETLINLSRNGLDTSKLDDQFLIDLFLSLDKGKISKEAITNILEINLKEGIKNIDKIISKLGIRIISERKLKQIIDNIIQENLDLINEKKERSFSNLMGNIMAIVRGKADGAKVSSLLKKKIEDAISKK
jgi:glutamyl-tRNA(Gln) amidotransferase subunit E